MRIVLKSKKGMTLIEVVVSLAILALLAVFITSVFGVSSDVIGSNAEQKRNSRYAAAGIENTMAGFAPDASMTIVDQESGNLEVVFDGVTVNSSGSFIKSSDIESKSRFYYFIPD